MPKVTSTDGTAIAYETLGAGPPLILIDGAMCFRESGPARPLAEVLKDRFTVVIYDRRGRGESGDTAPYAVSKEVEDIGALLDAVGGSAYIYGCSSGGALAMEAANTFDGVRKLIVYEAPFIVDNSRSPLTEEDQRQAGRYIAEGRRGAAVKQFMRFVGVPGFGIVMMQLMRGVWTKLTGIAHTLPYDYQIVGPYQRGKPLPAGEWRDIKAPVLVADGSKSPAWMRTGQQALAKNLGAEYRTLEGQTHIVKAEAHAPMIRDFFREA
jgi:pimeloyl-ACP methyl ester carboxylesterase